MPDSYDGPTFRRSVLIDTAAALLGVSRRTVYYRIRAGKLRTIRTRNGSQRVLCDSLEALLREAARPSGVAMPAATSSEAAAPPPEPAILPLDATASSPEF